MCLQTWPAYSVSGTSCCMSLMQSKENQIYNMNEYGSATLKYTLVFIYNINNNNNNLTYPSIYLIWCVGILFSTSQAQVIQRFCGR